MDLNKRLKVLENRLVSEPVTLTFADGSRALIPSRVNGRDHVAELLGAAIRGED